MNNDGNQSRIILTATDLSLNKYQSIFCSINSNSTLSASIKRLHIDGARSTFFDIISEWIFQENLIRFVNLKSLILTRCYLSETLINNLSLLVQYQLDELILTIDKDSSKMFESQQESCVNDLNQVYMRICHNVLQSKFQWIIIKLVVPKLKCFILKSKINDDSKFVYLKWFLNNVNHVEKLKLRLDINIKWQKDLTKRYCFIDANFIRQYCMPDTSTNLIDFNFYIVFKYHLLSENIQTIENSFKIHEFFIDRRWINVKCFFDPIMTYQHISSISIIKPEVFDGIKDYSSIFDWKNIKYLKVDLYPSIYVFLKQFNIIFSHINCIQFDMGSFKIKHASAEQIADYSQ
ncbi:unnamed protein product [Rotaria sp. Silwood2]|nr:unnamed protein product [Rotaria sp. Silwood2]